MKRQDDSVASRVRVLRYSQHWDSCARDEGEWIEEPAEGRASPPPHLLEPGRSSRPFDSILT